MHPESSLSKFCDPPKTALVQYDEWKQGGCVGWRRIGEWSDAEMTGRIISCHNLDLNVRLAQIIRSWPNNTYGATVKQVKGCRGRLSVVERVHAPFSNSSQFEAVLSFGQTLAKSPKSRRTDTNLAPCCLYTVHCTLYSTVYTYSMLVAHHTVKCWNCFRCKNLFFISYAWLLPHSTVYDVETYVRGSDLANKKFCVAKVTIFIWKKSWDTSL